MNKRKITTVIFDMDGTILNTIEDLADALNYALEKYGMPPRSLEEVTKFVGNGILTLIKRAVPQGTSDDIINEIYDAFKPYYRANCLNKTRPYDGITELMAHLKAEGYAMAIVSNKLDGAVKELNDTFFSEYINVAIGESEGVRRKPAPDTVYTALNELNRTKAESVYIGDSEVDFETAVNSGMPCISVLWGFRDREYLENIGASVFATDPKEIPNIIKGI